MRADIRLVFAFSSAQKKTTKSGEGVGVGVRVAHWVLEMRSVSSPSHFNTVQLHKTVHNCLHLPHYGTGNEQVVPTKKSPPLRFFVFFRAELKAETNLMIRARIPS